MPIRFIRGCEDKEAAYGKVFIYDGIYDVLEHKVETGKSGFDVIKFRLRRRPNQPPLTSTTVEFGHGSIPKAFTAMLRPGLVDDDISGGLERLPVVAVNDVDKELPPCTRPRKVLVRLWEACGGGCGCCCGGGGAFACRTKCRSPFESTLQAPSASISRAAQWRSHRICVVRLRRAASHSLCILLRCPFVSAGDPGAVKGGSTREQDQRQGAPPLPLPLVSAQPPVLSSHACRSARRSAA